MLATSACFKPSPPTGVPCETDAECPSSQVCHTVSRTCESSCDGCDIADAGNDSPPPDTAQANCWNHWFDRSVTFESVRKLDELGSEAAANGSVSLDGLVIYFERNSDPFRATRQDPAAPFGAPQLVTELRTDQRDSRISTTMDDRLAVFASARNGTLGLLDLWQARRQGNQPFGTPSSLLLTALNTTNNEFDPELTPDGLDLYWAPSNNGQLIRHASRGSVDLPFGNGDILPLTAPNQVNFFDPGISPDQLVIAFAADDGGLGATGNLFYATRASAMEDFGSAIELTSLNTMSHEGDADLAADGCTLYFTSNRDGSNAIYAASVQR